MSEDLENRVRDSLDGDAWQITPSRDLVAQASAQVRRTRRRRAGLGSVAAVAVALVAGVAIDTSTGPAPAAPSTDTSTPSPTTNQGIVRPGDLVRVQGTVYAPSGRTPELCGTLQIIDTLPAGVGCNEALTLSHLDPSQLTTPSAALAAPGILGTATFTGVWYPGHLDVRSQTAGEPAQTDDTFTDSLKHVPCPTPPGGWRSSPGGAISPPDMAGVEDYKAAHPTEVLSVAVFHPAGGTVIVLAVTDPAAAEAALAANFTGRLCVVRSRWTTAEVTAVHNAVHQLGLTDPTAGLSNGGTTVSPDGQLAIGVSAIARDPAVDRLLRQAPPGLVQFNALLQPAR